MKRLMVMAFTGTICLGALAACGGDDSGSASDVQKANTEFCQDLTAYTTSLKTLAGLTATSTKAQYQNAVSFEEKGDGKAAVKAYIGAARGGSCEAAKRLGDIFDKGLIGVSRDYAESLKWYNFARTLGTCEVPVAKSRS